MALMVWWLFFSRARRAQRLGGVGLIALAPGGTWLLKHDSMWLPWLFAYALPLLCLAFVTWAVVTSRLPDRVRRATMVATIFIACGAWLFVRQDGINGDHVATFGWRRAPSPEERLLAQTANEPATQPAAPAPTASTPITASPALLVAAGTISSTLRLSGDWIADRRSTDPSC